MKTAAVRVTSHSSFLKKTVLALLPIFGLVAITVFRFRHFAQYSYLIQEDGPLENIQFLGYLASSLVLGFTGFHLLLLQKLKKKVVSQAEKWRRRSFAVLCLSMAVVLFFVSFEEISWGQRLDNLQTPAYFAQHNVQNELSLHNLDTVQPYLELAYFVLGLGLVFVKPVVWLLSKLILKESSPKWLKQASKTLLAILPNWDLTWYFLPLSLIYGILIFYKPFGIILKTGVPLMIGRDQELGETLLAIGLFLHSWRMHRVKSLL